MHGLGMHPRLPQFVSKMTRKCDAYMFRVFPSPLLAGVAGAADDVRVRHGGRGAVGGGAGRRGGKLHLRRHPLPGIESTH